MNACAWRSRTNSRRFCLPRATGSAEARVKELWNGGNNASVALERKFPVHMVYFTAVVGDDGKVETFADVYGLDRKLAVAMFGDATGFPEPPPEKQEPPLGRVRRFDAGCAAHDGRQRHGAGDARVPRGVMRCEESFWLSSLGLAP